MNSERPPRKNPEKHTFKLNGTIVAEMLIDIQRFGNPLQSERIDAFREEVSRMTNNELIAIINSGESSDWRIRPLFYEAVYEELTARNLLSN